MDLKSLSLIITILFVCWLLAVGLATGALRTRRHFKRKAHFTQHH